MKRSRFPLAVALLAAAVCLTWSNHFRNGFHFDDAHTVVNNAFIRDLGNIPRFFRDASTFSSNPMNQAYRPVVTTTLAIDHRLGGGLNPVSFHASVFLLFLLQGVFMFLLFRPVLGQAAVDRDPGAVALFAVGWYLLHPANAETINYVIARGDSISTLFVVLAVLLHASFRRDGRRHLALLAGALGILTKPVAAVFPLLILVWELLCGPEAGRAGAQGKRRTPLPWRAAVAAAAPGLGATILLLAFIRAMSPTTWVPGGGSHLGYVMTQPLVVLHYVGTFFLPLRLSADTDWKALASVADPRFLAGVGGMAVLVWVAVVTARAREWRPVSFGLWWFLIALAPTSLVFPLAEVMNDHRVFFPYVGLVLAVPWAAALLLPRFEALVGRRLPARAVVAGAAVLLAAYAWGTHRRNEVWRSEETLWRDVTEKSPHNGRGWMNYGLTQMAKGELAAAEASYLKALELTPNYSYLHINLGIVRAAAGRTKEAEESFRRALSLAPAIPEPHVYFARFLIQQKRADEALPLLRRATELSPAHLEARRQLLAALEQKGRFDELEEATRELARLAPDDPAVEKVLAAGKSRRAAVDMATERAAREETPEAFLNLSLRRYRAGDVPGSIEAAEQALRLRPGYAAAHNNVCAGWNALRQWEKALPACERAVALDPASELARNNLAWARSRGGTLRTGGAK